MDVAGERHVDCNLSAGCTFLSEGPQASAVLGRGALQIFITNALKGVIAMEVISAHIISRAGVADPSQADRGELALWRGEMLGRMPTPPPLSPRVMAPVRPHTTHREFGHWLPGGIR